MDKIFIGYVITSDGSIFAQVPDEGECGFAIADDDQQWPGGFGIASSWEGIEDDDERIAEADRERLQGIIDNARGGGR